MIKQEELDQITNASVTAIDKHLKGWSENIELKQKIAINDAIVLHVDAEPNPHTHRCGMVKDNKKTLSKVAWLVITFVVLSVLIATFLVLKG